MRIIEAFEGELLNQRNITDSQEQVSLLKQIIEKDILKIVVKDRYNDSPPAIGFIKGFGIKKRELLQVL